MEDPVFISDLPEDAQVGAALCESARTGELSGNMGDLLGDT